MRVSGTLAAIGLSVALTGVAEARVSTSDPPSTSQLPGLHDLDIEWRKDGIAQQTPAAAPPVPEPPEAPVPPQEAPAMEEQSPPADGANPADPENVLPNLEGGGEGEDEFSVGEIPAVETVELTPEMARKSLDVYLLVRDKYKDADLENYENLQDFVDQAPQGKAFETDVKAAGFATVNDWNTAITMVGFAYSNIQDDQTADIRQQIEEVKQDTEMAQDMRDRMVMALQAMIPSDNNKKVVEELIKDPIYGEKLKQLENEEE